MPEKHQTKNTGKRRRDSVASGKSKNTTPQNTGRENPKPKSLLYMFRHKAGETFIALDNIETLHSMMVEEWRNAALMAVMKSSQREAN